MTLALAIARASLKIRLFFFLFSFFLHFGDEAAGLAGAAVVGAEAELVLHHRRGAADARRLVAEVLRLRLEGRSSRVGRFEGS